MARSMGSTSSTSRQLPDTVVVGRAHHPHGIRGEVAVEVLSDVPGRFAAGSSLWALGPRGKRRLTVRASRPHRGGLLVTFEGIEDRDAAAALRGQSLEIDRSEVPPPAAGEVYHYQLIGCRCSDLEAGELGEVTDVIEDGGGLLLLVVGPHGEVPVPFVRQFLRRLDVEAGELELALPPGLLETCASKS